MEPQDSLEEIEVEAADEWPEGLPSEDFDLSFE